MESGDASNLITNFKQKTNQTEKSVPEFGQKIFDPQKVREWILPVFQFTDYIEFIRSVIDTKEHLRGVKTKLAAAAKCQPSYLTQLLHGEAHLSLDQLYGIANYLKLAESEWEYLRELWLLSRSGTQELRESCQQKISHLREKYGGFVGAADDNLGEKDEKLYLFGTSWQHGAVYVGLAIAGMTTITAISKRFGMSLERAHQVIADLEAMGLITKDGENGWKKTSKNFTMDRRSPLSQLYRTAWYMKGMQSFFEDPGKNAHAGACFAISRKRIPEIEMRARELLYELFRDGDPSPKEAVVYFGFDLFEV